MEYLKVYDKICRVLIQYTQVNNANMLRINDPVEFGIKKNGQMVVLVKVLDNNHKNIMNHELEDARARYCNLTYFIKTDGISFSWYNYDSGQSDLSKFEIMIELLKDRITKVEKITKEENRYPFPSMSYISNMTGIECFECDGKNIFVFDDHRTTLDIIFEAHKFGLFKGETPNLITFDYHEDCCETLPKSGLLKKIGTPNISQASSRSFWSFVEFDLSKADDDWIYAAKELNLVKDVVIIGNEANSNVDNNEDLRDEDGNKHHFYSIPHLSFSLGCRGCLGDSIIKEPYYESIRNCLGYINGNFEPQTNNPIILDIDLDCFTIECKDCVMAWPECLFRKEFVENAEVNGFIKELINRSSFITISREPGCCGGFGESYRILSYLDKYFFNGCLKSAKIK